MTSVFKLTLAHFAFGAWRRWFVLAGDITILFYCGTLLAMSAPSYIAAVGFAGAAALFVGSSLMPIATLKLIHSRVMCTLPRGRPKLICSALLTTCALALCVPILTGFLLRATSPHYRAQSWIDYAATPFFTQMFLVSMIIWTWLYVVLWLLSTTRTAQGVIKAMFILAAIVFLPPQFISLDMQKSPVAPLSLLAITWGAFALYALCWPRIYDRLRTFAPRNLRLINATPINGREVALLLGVGNRWTHAAAVAIVVAMCAYIERNDARAGLIHLLLPQLALFGGAVAGVTTTRSRSLWMRGAWRREELFLEIESRYWRHMGPAIGVLLLSVLFAGWFADLSAARIALNVIVICAVYCASAYLGFMQTRGLVWADAILAIVFAVAAMGVAVFAIRRGADGWMVLLGTAGFAVLAWIFRRVAYSRWRDLDWLQCKPMKAT